MRSYPAESAQLIELATDGLGQVINTMNPICRPENFEALKDTAFLVCQGLIYAAQTEEDCERVWKVAEAICELFK
jgi:hypothetical protein